MQDQATMFESAMGIQELRQVTQSGKRLKYLFFWGHPPDASGEVGRRCLSQWWTAAFELNGVRYPTAEHFMLAEKAWLFGDDEGQDHRGPQSGRGETVRAGCAGVWPGDWEQSRFDIVVLETSAEFRGFRSRAAMALFAQSHELRAVCANGVDDC